MIRVWITDLGTGTSTLYTPLGAGVVHTGSTRVTVRRDIATIALNALRLFGVTDPTARAVFVANTLGSIVTATGVSVAKPTVSTGQVRTTGRRFNATPLSRDTQETIVAWSILATGWPTDTVRVTPITGRAITSVLTLILTLAFMAHSTCVAIVLSEARRALGTATRIQITGPAPWAIGVHLTAISTLTKLTTNPVS